MMVTTNGEIAKGFDAVLYFDHRRIVVLGSKKRCRFLYRIGWNLVKIGVDAMYKYVGISNKDGEKDAP